MVEGQTQEEQANRDSDEEMQEAPSDSDIDEDEDEEMGTGEEADPGSGLDAALASVAEVLSAASHLNPMHLTTCTSNLCHMSLASLEQRSMHQVYADCCSTGRRHGWLDCAV